MAFGGLLVVWNPVPLVGVLERPQFLSSPGCAVALVGCTAFAVMGTSFLTGPRLRGSAREPYGVIFLFLAARRPLRAVRVRRLFLLFAPGPRDRPLGSCRVGPATIFDIPAARSPWLVALRTPHGAISCLWEVLGRPGGALASPPAGNFCWGGGRRAALPGAHVPSFLCSGGVRSPGEVGVLGHPGFGCRPGAGLALSPGSQGVSRRALHSLRGPGPAPQTQYVQCIMAAITDDHVVLLELTLQKNTEK